MIKVHFDSITELQEAFPIGFIIKRTYNTSLQERYFYNRQDYNILKQEYDSIEPIDDITANCFKKEIKDEVVEGYLYDGEYWRPAYNTWDGWYPYDEDDF